MNEKVTQKRYNLSDGLNDQPVFVRKFEQVVDRGDLQETQYAPGVVDVLIGLA